MIFPAVIAFSGLSMKSTGKYTVLLDDGVGDFVGVFFLRVGDFVGVFFLGVCRVLAIVDDALIDK